MLADVIGWIKDNSRLEKTKRKAKKKKVISPYSSKEALWYSVFSDYDLDYINALLEIESYTGISTESQRYEYYMMFDHLSENLGHDIGFDDDYYNSVEYTYDDIADEISNVGNVSHFEDLDVYSDNLENSEASEIVDEHPADFEQFDFDDEDDIPEDILENPENLLKYLMGQIRPDTFQQNNTAFQTYDISESEQGTDFFDSDDKDDVSNVDWDKTGKQINDLFDQIDSDISHQNKNESQIEDFSEAKQITLDMYDEIEIKTADNHLAGDAPNDIDVQETIEDNNPIEKSAVEYILNQTKKPVKDSPNMISHFELISLVNVHSETVFRYINEKKIIPDRVEKSGSHSKYFFSQDNVRAIIEKFGWYIISESNKRRVFFQMIDRMTMSFSYKPVFIKAFLSVEKDGKASMSKIVGYFRDFYEQRRKAGLFVEKSNSIFAHSGYTDKEVKKLILVYPYKRFAEMKIFSYSKLFGVVSMDTNVWNSLQSSDKIEICRMCDEHIEKYFSRFQ